MRYALLVAMLVSCAPVHSLTRHDKELQCRDSVCPTARTYEQAGPGGDSSYDDLDDTCICRFRDGRYYITPRR